MRMAKKLTSSNSIYSHNTGTIIVDTAVQKGLEAGEQRMEAAPYTNHRHPNGIFN